MEKECALKASLRALWKHIFARDRDASYKAL